jgi:serine/threonine protein kinase/putative transposon-encoded protein
MHKIRLYDGTGLVRLQIDTTRAIDQGGEGLIIPHPKEKNQVIKIYHTGITPCLTSQAWIHLNQLDKRFIKPLELFYNDSGELAGFSMHLLDKSFFRISQLFTKAQCLKLGIKDDIKKRISEELISVIDEAHKKNIIIGDFNQYNIFINGRGDVQIIDVDSFETSVQKHSGRQLDEIRDHYYLGAVNKQSDYYALAINIFRLLTYVHPYKGIHKIWKQLEERAIKQISILGNDADLIIPGFYEPIADKGLESQFRRIFEDGERFKLQVDLVNVTRKKAIPQKVSYDNISVKLISGNVLDFFFNEYRGYIKTEKETEIIECDYSGNLKAIRQIDNKAYDHLWIGNKNTLQVKDNKLFHNHEQINNLEIPEDFRFKQMDHIIFGVDQDNIYHIYPDKIINRNLYIHKIPAWGRGFRFEESPVQLTGGIMRAHFLNGNSVNSLKLPFNPRRINILGNVGLIYFTENETIKNHWFLLKELNFILEKETEEIFSFTVKKNGDSTFVFVPSEGRIEILRIPDFSVIDYIYFRECTSHSQIYVTRSGLLLLENQHLYLINRK